ncbi:selenocysteine 1-associated 1-like [Octopus vulgaris]|uniref:tRNA selenocysteine-associated protein 1 n=1 Tax=Octopus vulgaris TaxID=6645 RepID=A0AA36F7D1_OCTVU|nr:selenocysteine 1-associated 1-like [Octopus vulgaris]
MSATGTSTLWMGDLEPYMDEGFITQAFSYFGETVVSVKIIRNKQTGVPAGYCFVELSSPEMAHRAMLRLNGKIVPNSIPPKRFKLNRASYGKEHLSTPEYSLFVGDLSDDVDDYELYSAFSKCFRSCSAAKVVLDNYGRSKGYGFVRFTDESEQQKAMFEMQHVSIGRRPIRVSLATPKRPPPPDVPGTQSAQQYSQYYQQYQQYQYYQSWSAYSQYYSQFGYPYAGGYTTDHVQDYYDQGTDEEMEMLEDPILEIDVDKVNAEFIEQSEEIFEALDDSRWQPIDNVMTTLSQVATAVLSPSPPSPTSDVVAAAATVAATAAVAAPIIA